jgi:hypothetical protein
VLAFTRTINIIEILFYLGWREKEHGIWQTKLRFHSDGCLGEREEKVSRKSYKKLRWRHISHPLARHEEDKVRWQCLTKIHFVIWQASEYWQQQLKKEQRRHQIQLVERNFSPDLFFANKFCSTLTERKIKRYRVTQKIEKNFLLGKFSVFVIFPLWHFNEKFLPKSITS